MIVCCEKYIITTIIIIINYNDLNKILMYSYTLKVNACRNTKYKYNDKNDTLYVSMYYCFNDTDILYLWVMMSLYKNIDQ